MDFITLVILVIVLVAAGAGFVFGNMYPVLQPFLTDDDEEEDEKIEGDSEELDESIAIPLEMEATLEIQETESGKITDGVILPIPQEDYPELVEVVRLFRDPHEYKLYAYIDSKLVIGIQGLDMDQLSALTVLVSELEDWLKADPDANSGDASVPVVLKKGPIPSPDQKFTTPQSENEEQQNSKIISLNPLKVFENVVMVKAKPEHKSRNIAEEINAILQKIITDTPLEVHGLEVRNKADGSLAFVVREEVYNSMDEIKDEGIRSVLQQAIEQWDQS